MSIDSVRYFQINGQVYPLLSKFLIQAVAANVSLVAGVAGQSVRVMGYRVASTAAGAVGAAVFLDASGGTIKDALLAPDPAVNNPYERPVIDTGYFETTSGNGLFLTVQTNSVNVFVNYIQYTV